MPYRRKLRSSSNYTTLAPCQWPRSFDWCLALWLRAYSLNRRSGSSVAPTVWPKDDFPLLGLYRQYRLQRRDASNFVDLPRRSYMASKSATEWAPDQSNSRRRRIFTARQHSLLCYKRCISYSKSIRLSVRLSHAGTVSKRLQLRSCGLHWRIAP